MIQQGYYKHFKGGIYQVIGIAKNSETLDEKVIYRGVDGRLWERPINMWNEEVNGVPRYELFKNRREGWFQFELAKKAFRERNKAQ